jgi:nitroimidazol reductase NimA-like FMN-containing flavoprotein (pyridoxamine 5'-phosphate oxidase superfamily)
MKRTQPQQPKRAPARPRSSRVADAPAAAPTIRPLSRPECDAILERNNLGRLAFSFHDRVDIEPMHYVHDNGWLIGRTSYGAKLSTLRHSPWVAFEVDEVAGLFDWRSVVVHGVFDILTADGPAANVQRWEHAIEALRRLVPATAAPGDPVPFRTVVFRIGVDSVSGRESTTRVSGASEAE